MAGLSQVSGQLSISREFPLSLRSDFARLSMQPKKLFSSLIALYNHSKGKQ
jgi:hypothetical protein